MFETKLTDGLLFFFIIRTFCGNIFFSFQSFLCGMSYSGEAWYFHAHCFYRRIIFTLELRLIQFHSAKSYLHNTVEFSFIKALYCAKSDMLAYIEYLYSGQLGISILQIMDELSYLRRAWGNNGRTNLCKERTEKW